MPSGDFDRSLRSLCLTCGGSGVLDRPLARLDDGSIIVGVTSEECWFCRGDGWIPFARRDDDGEGPAGDNEWDDLD